MNPFNEQSPQKQQALQIARRHFLGQCGVGVGKIALASLLTDAFSSRSALAGPVASPAASSSAGPLAQKPPHFRPTAKHVIHLFMAGGPSHLDLYDYKPELARLEGKPIPPSVIRGQRYAFIRSDAGVLGPQFKFARHGHCGIELAEVMPHLGEVVDDVCFVKSMHTEQFNHAPAQIFMNSGFAQPGRPSMGSWVLYALGSESQNLPGFVVMSTGSGISGGSANWSSGFLPTLYAGVRFRNHGDPILDVSNPGGIDAALQRDSLDLIGALNQRRLAIEGDPEIATRLASYEMASRLQTSAPELTDLRSETKATLDMYGCDPAKPSFARSCLLARRMVERGVRFVNIYHEGWDAHGNLQGNHRETCGDTDQGAAALVKDLKQRGLLDETLVIWGGEFGRTPMVQTNPAMNQKLGRDHHPQAFTMWMAGGGMKRGYAHGGTDDMGFHAVDKPVAVFDLQAMILHALGLDHERLTFRFQGRDFRLTDVHGAVVKDLLA